MIFRTIPYLSVPLPKIKKTECQGLKKHSIDKVFQNPYICVKHLQLTHLKMTLQEAIKQTESLTKDQKIQLAYYILFSNLKEDNRDNLMQLFQHVNDFELKEKEQGTKKRVFKSKGLIQLNNDFDTLNIREDIYNDLLNQYD